MRRMLVDFSVKLRPWDGFGANYVETAQTRDYQADPQEYGGFSVLSEEDRPKVVDLVFGADGLRPGVVKMFLDPFHQPKPGPGTGPDGKIDLLAYDHTTTTRWMRFFVTEGLKRTRDRGGDLQAIVTLYGPPAWMTKQGFVRGRDLDPEHADDCARYLVSWAKYLREVECVPVKYVSLHNEGEDWHRWPADGSTAGAPNHDYNLYWPPEQVADFIPRVRAVLDREGMDDVGVAPGETTTWYRFNDWGYADALADNARSVEALGLIASHGFRGAPSGRWFGDWRSAGIDTLRAARPGLHAWTTSTSWSKMDAFFAEELRNQIYATKVNAIIPWAAVQRSKLWVGGDPNPGTAIRVNEEGTFTVEPGYYFYQQVCRAGQPGMSVCRALSNDSEVSLIGFAGAGTRHPDAFVLLNLTGGEQAVEIQVRGAREEAFAAFRTSPTDRFAPVSIFPVRDGRIGYTAPAGSVTTFFAELWRFPYAIPQSGQDGFERLGDWLRGSAPGHS